MNQPKENNSLETPLLEVKQEKIKKNAPATSRFDVLKRVSDAGTFIFNTYATSANNQAFVAFRSAPFYIM